MPRAAWFLALSVTALANGATLDVEFSGPQSLPLTLPVAVDDAHLADPPGYFAPTEPRTRVVRRIVVENTGSAPISNPDIRINGQPLLPVADPLAELGITDPHDLPALFAAWRDRVIHATTNLDASRDPLVLLDALGAAYCGDDARALAAITVANGGEARFARLNGHSVTEHRNGDSWVLLDGDQNLLYLAWDNRTPVGEAEILADPLLALRTQVFGRQSSWEAPSAWQNTSRFEFVDRTREQKNFHIKDALPAPDWELQPGEKIVFVLDSEPPLALAATDDLRASTALRSAVCPVEFHLQRGDSARAGLPFPAVTGAAGEPAYEASSSDRTILCQAARAGIPLLRSGSNSIESKTPGKLRVTFEYEPASMKSTPVPIVTAGDGSLGIEADGADRVWWQISGDSDFRLVAPNLDREQPYAPKIALSRIDRTFLSKGTWFARAKVRRAGAWSDWSSPASFTVDKPAAPRRLGMEKLDDDQMRIHWEPCDGEMLVFGSGRLDFLPEIYGDTEVVRMENGAVRESRPNKNLLATVSAKDGEARVPACACYRLVVRRDAAFSLPSSLLRAKNMTARVLQNRQEKKEGALTGTDVAVEMDVPLP